MMESIQTKILFVHNHLTEFIKKDLEILQIKYSVTEFDNTKSILNIYKTAKLVLSHDLVFGWFASEHTFLPTCFARLFSKPTILIIGGYDVANLPEIDYGHQRGGVKKWISRMTMRLATKLLAFSFYSKDEAVRNAELLQESIEVAYMGIPSESGAELSIPRQRMAITVGHVKRSNLVRKGHLAFVQAASLLPDINFVLVGPWLDDAMVQLREIAGPNVHFTGYVDSLVLQKYYKQASV